MRPVSVSLRFVLPLSPTRPTRATVGCVAWPTAYDTAWVEGDELVIERSRPHRPRRDGSCGQCGAAAVALGHVLCGGREVERFPIDLDESEGAE